MLDSERRLSALRQALVERRNYAVHVATTNEKTENLLRSASFDVVVMDISSNKRSDWDALSRIRLETVNAARKPMILCISATDLGPEARLAVERKGGRFVLIRE